MEKGTETIKSADQGTNVTGKWYGAFTQLNTYHGTTISLNTFMRFDLVQHGNEVNGSGEAIDGTIFTISGRIEDGIMRGTAVNLTEGATAEFVGTRDAQRLTVTHEGQFRGTTYHGRVLFLR